MLSVQSESFYNVLNDKTIQNSIQRKTGKELIDSIDYLIRNPGTKNDMYILIIHCLYLYTDVDEEEFRQNLFTFPDEEVELTVRVDSFMMYLHSLYSSVKMKVFDMEETYELLPAWIDFGSFIEDVYDVSEDLMLEGN